MPEETKESKASKLAAARKKLKEYQKRGSDTVTTTSNAISCAASATSSTIGHQRSTSMSSNFSEKSDSELNFNGSGSTVGNSGTATPQTSLHDSEETAALPVLNENSTSSAVSTAAIYFSAPATATVADAHFAAPIPNEQQIEAQPHNLNAIQLLITEKAQLTTELNKYRVTCREKDLELEELRTQFNNTSRRAENLEQRFLVQQQTNEQLRNDIAGLQQQLARTDASCKDQEAHLDELKKQLSLAQARIGEVEQQYKEKCNELEMSQIRIRQLSDEAGINKDNRVETLTQRQFMYEQQIRDLQAMVQQHTQDKEQANTQYQNYVQHLNTEVTSLKEKNGELMDECAKLQERERQLVDHVSGLEREIQKNISRQAKVREEQKQETPTEVKQEIERLQEKISGFDSEKYEFQLKIKSQEDRLEQLSADLQQKQNDVEELLARMEHVSAEQPDTTRLLATMESDKVAASRALSQNIELKKQLDELELRFVQLTNDKADLRNQLDAEEFANREMRVNFAAMEERLHNIDERFKFKDEEMIRLSHENEELIQKNSMLQQQLERSEGYEVKEYGDNYRASEYEIHDSDEHAHEANEHEHHNHEHNHGEGHDHHHHHHDHAPINDFDKEQKCHSENESCQEAKEEDNAGEDKHDHAGCTHTHAKVSKPEVRHAHQHNRIHHEQPHMPTAEAVERLQQRFTQLISQVADLTDEKQRLEHLVLQLQSETETIGEYITLYQTQRRILKQREYEKASQMQLLQQEREELREKITILNNLVNSLGVEYPQNMHLKAHLDAALAEGVANVPTTVQQAEGGGGGAEEHQQQQQQQLLSEAALNQKLNSIESQEILTKIQDIITEIKENTKREVPTVTHTVDHLNCCLGKFEVV